jgi:hypothetical protein
LRMLAGMSGSGFNETIGSGVLPYPLRSKDPWGVPIRAGVDQPPVQ